MKFQSLEAAFAAIVPLSAVFGSLGGTISPGCSFALAFLCINGVVIACLDKWFPRALARTTINVNCDPAHMKGIDDGIDTPSQLSGLNVQMEDNEEEFEPLLGSMQT